MNSIHHVKMMFVTTSPFSLLEVKPYTKNLDLAKKCHKTLVLGLPNPSFP